MVRFRPWAPSKIFVCIKIVEDKVRKSILVFSNGEKIGDGMIRAFTLPIRVGIGLYKCIEKNTPERLEMPFEIKRKEETDGRNKETTSC